MGSGVIQVTPDNKELIFQLRKLTQKFEKDGESEYFEVLSPLLNCIKKKMPLNALREDVDQLIQLWTKRSKVFDGDVSCVDVSGSMSGIPMEVAITMGLLVSDLQSEDSPWKNRVYV